MKISRKYAYLAGAELAEALAGAAVLSKRIITTIRANYTTFDVVDQVGNVEIVYIEEHAGELS